MLSTRYDPRHPTRTKTSMMKSPPMKRPAPMNSLTPRGLEIHELQHRFPGAQDDVLRDLHLTVAPGELVVLTGASGAGKTTLLYLAAGVDRPTRGEIRVGGLKISEVGVRQRARLRRTEVALVPQAAWLLPHLTALENVALPRRLQGGELAAVSRRRALEELAAVGCRPLAEQPAARLSGGERARVALARALVTEASLVLVDEPTGHLDPQTEEVIVGRLVEAAREEGRAVLVASHEPALARRADRVHHLAAGRLSEESKPGVAGEPRVDRTAEKEVGEGSVTESGRETHRTTGLRHLPALAWLLTRGFRGRLALGLVGIALGVGVLFLLLGLLRGGGEALTSQVLGGLPAGHLRVRPASLSLGVVELDLERFRGGVLDAEARAELARLPGVEAVHPQVFSSFPVSISAHLLGRSVYTDVALEGVTAEWLADDVPPEDFQWDATRWEQARQEIERGESGGRGGSRRSLAAREIAPGPPVPAVLADSLIALFNAGFARSHGLPRIGPKTLEGATLRGVLGSSSFERAAGPPLRVDFEVVGFSSRVSPLTLAVPYDALERWNRIFARREGDEGAELERRVAPASVVLELADLERAPEVTAAVEEKGFRIDEGEGLAPRLGGAMRVLQASVAGFGLLVLGLFAVLLAQLFAARLEVRRRWLDLLEVLGATRGQVLALLGTEIALVAWGGAVLGAGFALWAGARIATALQDWAWRALSLGLEGLFQLSAGPVTLLLGVLPLVTLLLALPGTLARLRRPLLERLRETA